MMRILGIVCGAAIAVALLTWLVGVPQFTSQRSAEGDEPIAVVALQPPPAPVKAAAGPANGANRAQEATLAADASPAPAPAPTPSDSPSPATADAPPSPPEEPATVVALGAGEAMADAVPPAAPPVLPDQWYAFWSPFRSEIAANGFVAELQRVTGLDYRVVKVKPGVYEVAFSYADEESIEHYLSTISAATGLDLPGDP